MKETTSSLDKEIGSNMRIRRTTAGLTQADVAKHLQISPQQYQKYEKGSSKCSIETIYKLVDYYEASLDDFLPQSQAESEPGGFSEPSSTFALQSPPDKMTAKKADLDEAEAMAELLAVFMRIETKKQRRRVLSLLNQMFSETTDLT